MEKITKDELLKELNPEKLKDEMLGNVAGGDMTAYERCLDEQIAKYYLPCRRAAQQAARYDPDAFDKCVAGLRQQVDHHCHVVA